jgi:hypothetical protein
MLLARHLGYMGKWSYTNECFMAGNSMNMNHFSWCAMLRSKETALSIFLSFHSSSSS